MTLNTSPSMVLLRHVRLLHIAIVVLAIAPAPGAAHALTSCPLSNEVYPFREMGVGFYSVELTDGGPGDADNAIDDTCLFRTRLCLGSNRATPDPCQPARIDRFTVDAFWRADPAVRDVTVDNVVDGISRMFGGPEIDDNTIAFDEPPRANGQCVEVPVRVPAFGSPRRLRIKFAVEATADDGTDGSFSSRLWLKCRRRLPSGETRTRCRASGGDCMENVELPPGVPGGSSSPDSPPPAPLPNTPPVGERLFYISPGGSDSNAGTSPLAPWRTFGRVLNSSKPLRPGDTLVLLDGTYTRTTTGLPVIDCGSPGTASNGEPGRPITIRALNEHRAHLRSDGRAPGFQISDCSWWVVSGLRASNQDNAAGEPNHGYPFRFLQVSNVTGARLLGSHNNRAWNTHVFAVELSQNVLLEECEAYYYHRHGFSIWKSRYVDLRRCYANSMLYGVNGCCGEVDNRDYGDEAYSLYGTSDSIVENCISENRANGFQIHGVGSPLDPSGHGGRNNRVLGSISFEDSVAALVGSRAGGPTSYHNASGNLFRDYVAANMGGNGLFFRGSAGTVVENATLFGSQSNSGLNADGGDRALGGTCSASLVCTDTGEACSSNDQCSGGVCTRNPRGCSFVARNVLAANNSSYGLRSTDHAAWRIEHSNAAGNGSNYSPSESIGDTSGNIRSSMSTTPTAIGIGSGRCLPWIMASSNMARAGQGGGPLGANVLYRYEGGTLTTRPLWDSEDGSFPCGAIVTGVSDGSKRCRNLHARLGVTSGCQFPSGYGD